jgi:hypothetical protein
MSIRVTSLVWDAAPVAGTELLVLLVIADHASDDGTNAWPAVETIARKCRVTPRSVQRCLANLVIEGLIEVATQRGGDERVRSDRRPNRYRVVVEKLSTGVTPTSPREAERGDAGVANGVTPVSPKPSLEPSIKNARVRTLSTVASDLGGEREYVAL